MLCITRPTIMIIRSVFRDSSRTNTVYIIVQKCSVWKFSGIRFLKPSTSKVSLEGLRNSPPSGSFSLRNAYIPLNRRTVIRELLQDVSVVLPSEREHLEQLASSLYRKLNYQFLQLQNEFSVLSQSVEPATHPVQSVSQKTITEPQIDTSAQPSSSSDRLDREFWLLRRLSQIAFKAGFTEVTRDELERACSPKDFKRQGAVSYVNPKDYDVIRFWVRGVHPQLLRVLPTASETTACADTSSGALRRTSSFVSCVFSSLKQVGSRITHESKRLLCRLLGSAVGPKYTFPCKPTDPIFTNVLLAVRRKQDNRLHLKFFEYVPASKSSSRSTYTDNLVYLLPE
ncbi:hypothetical protein PHET_00099 [Paragonimus heterotremus]|uniref:Uncharacterized protein n=1 Tax=Paragonimus heterotremus TaxID=100268 RepID=A0A8J4WLC5_9TREM|nr:hypothetical protein PHET_00099 [Paragonimus heterotremus]